LFGGGRPGVGCGGDGGEPGARADVSGERRDAGARARELGRPAAHDLRERPSRIYAHDHAGRLVQKTDGASGAALEQFGFDVEGHLKTVTRSGVTAETLAYDPGGALLFRKVGAKGTWYVGEFATVTADVSGTCPGTGCTATNVQVGEHVLL